MANTPYHIGWNIHANVDVQEINDANKVAGEFDSKMSKVSKTIKDTGDSSKSTAKDLKDLSTQAQELGTKGVNGSARLGRSIHGTGGEAGKAAGEIGKLHKAITSIKDVGTQSFKAVSDNVKRLGEQSQAARKKLDRLNETGKKWQSTGRSMLPATVAIGAAFVKGAKDATSLQHEYTIVKNLVKTGGESTRESIKNTSAMMRDGRKYSLQYGKSQQDIASGYEVLVRRGYSSTQALAAQKSYMQASIASGDKYSDVINNGAAAVEQFGLRSKNMNVMTQNTKTALNQMAYAADLTATSFSDLGVAMKYAGPQAHSANQSLSSTSAAIGLLSNYGVDGSNAGTSMRQIYQRLIKMPEKGNAADAMKQLGLSNKDFRDSKNQLLPIVDIFDKLNKQMKGMSTTQKGGIYSALFGTYGSTAGNIIGAHTKDLRELNAEVAKSQKQDNGKGYIAGLSDKNMESWQNQFKKFKAAVSDLGMSFARDVLPSVTPVVKQITNLVEGFANLSPNMKKVVTYGAGFTAIAGPLLMTVGSLARGVSSISKSITFAQPFLTAGGYLSKASRTARKTSNSKVSSTLATVAGDFGTSGGALQREAKSAGKTFSSNATKSMSSKASTAGNNGGKKFNYQVKSGTVKAGNDGGKKFSTYVKRNMPSAGTSAGSKFSTRVHAMRWASFGVAVGAAVLKHGNAGEKAGTGIGAGIGMYLGGPEGAAIGAWIGGAIADTIEKQTPKSYGSSKPTKDQKKRSGGVATHNTTVITPMGVTNIGDGAGNTSAGYNSSNKKYSASARAFSSKKKSAASKVARSGIKIKSAFATGGLVAGAQTALVGEGGPELAYTVNGRKARLLGANGAQFAKVKPGERILNAKDTRNAMNGGTGGVLPGYATGKDAKQLTAGNTKSKDSLTKLSKQSKKIWKDTASDTSKNTNKIHKNTVKDFDTMQKSTQVQMNQLHKGVKSAATGTAVDFGKAMGRMDNYAHSAMKSTINQLNTGITGIDSVLGQFGGGSSVIKPIHYATGSNGELSNNQLAMVNDATHGPRQELIVRNGQVIAPAGRNRVVQLHKGDQVLNGEQSAQWAALQGIPHFAKGSGVSKTALSKLIDTNHSHPAKQFNNVYLDKVNAAGSSLQKGATNLAAAASKAKGYPWNTEVWKQMSDAKSGTSAGGAVRHSPGAGFQVTSGFGNRGAVSGGFSSHDGVDYSGAKTVHAMNTGKVTHAGGAPAKWGGNNGIGENVVISGGGLNYIYQELNGKSNTGAKLLVKDGDTVSAGQAIAVLGPDGSHVHVGATRHKMFSIGGSSTAGWLDPRTIKSKAVKTPKKANSALTKLVKSEISSQLKYVSKNLQEDFGDFGSFNSGGNAITKAMIAKAEEVMKVPESIRGKVASDIMRMAISESGNRNVAQKIHDVNSANGNPAGGPLQYVKSTFMNYAVPGHKNWNSPYDQVLAYLNNSQYKTATGMTTIWGHRKFDWLGLGPHGSRRFANGGWAAKNAVNIFGEVPGEPEVAINPSRSTADGLIDQTIQARAKAEPSSPSSEFLKSMKSSKITKSQQVIKPEINININGDISDERMLKKTQDMIERSLAKVFKQIDDEYGLDESVY